MPPCCRADVLGGKFFFIVLVDFFISRGVGGMACFS